MADETANMDEIGISGLKQTGGILQEEFLADLKGAAGVKAFVEMRDNDPVVGGMLLAITEIVAGLDWRVVPPQDPTPQEVEAADFVESCRTDMSSSWDAILSEILTMAPFGWAYMETVFKIRGGPTEVDSTRKSAFADARIGWRKFALRSQETRLRWSLDENGGILGMVQKTLQGEVFIPIERALLFRTSEAKNNPEGRSLLRNAYRPWFYMKRIEESEAVGIERDLAGLPRVYAPPDWFDKSNEEGKKRVAELVELVQNVRQNETSGILLPSYFDDKGNRLLEFDLVTAAGSRQFDTDKIVQRYATRVAMALLMDFLTLGHDGGGAYNLGTAKISLWQLTIAALAKSVAEVVNTHAIPRLVRINGIAVERMPVLSFGNVEEIDLAALGGFLKDMIDSGIIVPDDALEAYVRDMGRLPEPDPNGRA